MSDLFERARLTDQELDYWLYAVDEGCREAADAATRKALEVAKQETRTWLKSWDGNIYNPVTDPHTSCSFSSR